MKKIDMTAMLYKQNRKLAGLNEIDAAIVANAEAAEAVANVTAIGTSATLTGSLAIYARTLVKTGSNKKATGLACFAAGVGSVVTNKVSRAIGKTVFARETVRLMQPAGVEDETNENPSYDDFVEE